MTGIEEIGALLASAATAAEAALPALPSFGAAAGPTALAGGGGSLVTGVSIPGVAAAGGAGYGVGSALKDVGAAAQYGGTAAQLLSKPPGTPKLPGAPSIDQARIEADQRNELLKRKGRASALLAGGAQGDKSSPSLGAAQLLGPG